MNKPKCSKCGRSLKDPFSVAVGMGPECRGALKSKGWKFPKPKFKISGGSVVFVGVEGKITPPPTVNVSGFDTREKNTRATQPPKKKEAHDVDEK